MMMLVHHGCEYDHHHLSCSCLGHRSTEVTLAGVFGALAPRTGGREVVVKVVVVIIIIMVPPAG
jgi:hypothetical protein